MGNWKVIIPEAATNLITNPSFETNTTGWSAGGTNTVTRIVAKGSRGAYAGALTYQDNATLAQYTITVAAGSHTFALDLWIPANYDGTAITLRFNAFTGSTGDANVAADMTKTAQWQRLELTNVIDSGDLTGNLQVRESGTPTAGRFVYIDAVQLEANSYATTYIDGDQQGCKWLGTPHASTSTRDANEYSGGRVMDFADDYSFTPQNQIGLGLSTVQNQLMQNAILDGGTVSGQRVASRLFAITGGFFGSTQANLHSLRQALIKALNSRTAGINQKAQPRRLRYTGAGTAKEIDAYYNGGLELSGQKGFAEDRVVLTFLAADPHFKQIGETAAGLTGYSTLAYNLLLARESGAYNVMGAPFATGTPVYNAVTCFAVGPDGCLYIGGDFTDFDGNAGADNIVKYNPANGSYSELAALNNVVNDLCFGPDGTLYAVGDFTNAGGDANADYIAQWNGSAWSAVGIPNTGTASFTITPQCCAFGTDGNLYVGGGFRNLADVAAADGIAKWNGSAWSALGSGLTDGGSSGVGYKILPIQTGGIYVIGSMENVGDANGDGVLKWTGSAWESLGTGIDMTNIPQCGALDHAGNLYVGGTANSVPTSVGVAMWNGSSWSGLGVGLSTAAAKAMAYHNNNLYVGGAFTTAGGVATGNSATWNGHEWNSLDTYMTIGVDAFAFIGNDRYFGFDTNGTLYASAPANISYNGTARAYPYIKIKRSGGTSGVIKTIQNYTTGAALHFSDYALLNGEELVIDLRPGKYSIVSSFFGSRWDALRNNSDVSQFYLEPGNGSAASVNKILVFMESAPTSITANIIWQDTFGSVD